MTRSEKAPRTMQRAWNVAEAISMRGRKMPDAPALLSPEGALNFGELDATVKWTANWLKSAGLQPGDIVGVQVADRARHLLVSLALSRIGAAQIAFQEGEPPRAQEQLGSCLKFAATVVDESAKRKAPGPLLELFTVPLNELKHQSSAEVPAIIDADLPCFYDRTSGTTGVPKLFVLTQSHVYWRLRSWGHLLPGGPGTRFLSLSSLSYPARKFDALDCLLRGSCLVIFSGHERSDTFLDLVIGNRVNSLFGVPVHAQSLLRLAKEGELLFPAVDAFRMSSTLIPDTLRQQIQDRLTTNLYIGFGTSETGRLTVATPSQVREIPGVVGRVVPGSYVEVVDQADQRLPPGRVGQLRLKSAGMTDGYLDSPDVSAAQFRDGWFHPGDIGEMTPDGALIHHGRADDLMIHDGINIYPAEIENALLLHPAVAEVTAFPIRDKVKGERPVIAIVTRATVSNDELVAHCRSWLGVKSPHAVMRVEQLPRNAAGKVVKSELQRQFLQRAARKRRERQHRKNG